MRIFSGERVQKFISMLNNPEDEPIEAPMVNRAIEGAQRKVEGHNFEARKHLLEYDDVMNKQRTAIYTLRRQIMESPDQKEYTLGIADEVVRDFVENRCPKDAHPDQWDVNGLRNDIFTQFGLDIRAEGFEQKQFNHDELLDLLIEKVRKKYD